MHSSNRSRCTTLIRAATELPKRRTKPDGLTTGRFFGCGKLAGMRAASIWMQGFGQFEPVNLDAFERFLAVELGDDAP